MLGTIVSLGPPAARLEFDSEEIADFAKDTILHFADQFATRMADIKTAFESHRPLHLEAGTGERDVFEIRHASPGAPVRIFPFDIHEIRAEHSWFNTPVHHIYPANRPLNPID